MKCVTLILGLWWMAVAGSAATTNTVYAVYDAAGVRDPMLKPLSLPLGQTGDVAAAVATARPDRSADIARALANCKIEGVAIAADLRMTVINDRLLREGDRLTPDVAVRIAQIDLDRIVFALDDDTYEYKFSPAPETPR